MSLFTRRNKKGFNAYRMLSNVGVSLDRAPWNYMKYGDICDTIKIAGKAYVLYRKIGSCGVVYEDNGKLAYVPGGSRLKSFEPNASSIDKWPDDGLETEIVDDSFNEITDNSSGEIVVLERTTLERPFHLYEPGKPWANYQ